MQLTNAKIVEQFEKYTQAKQEFEDIVQQEQIKCSHDYIAELDCGSSPPMRVCLSCGITEDGWGCGFILLKNKTELGVPSIKRDAFFELRQGYYLRESLKGPLLRREVTIADLILLKNPVAVKEN